MKRIAIGVASVFGLALFGAGCGGSKSEASMMGPSGVSSQARATFMSIAPQGGATGVAGSISMVFRFNAPMGSGMEQYVDLHVGDVAGPTMPVNCNWSTDRTTLTCTPRSPLASRTTYVMHLGGGLMTQAGQYLDCAQYGPMLGGQWVMGGMMSGSHAGVAWTMMGANWRNTNGSQGMAFPFTTA
jgi:hypothetical protein